MQKLRLRALEDDGQAAQQHHLHGLLNKSSQAAVDMIMGEPSGFFRESDFRVRTQDVYDLLLSESFPQQLLGDLRSRMAPMTSMPHLGVHTVPTFHYYDPSKLLPMYLRSKVGIVRTATGPAGQKIPT